MIDDANELTAQIRLLVRSKSSESCDENERKRNRADYELRCDSNRAVRSPTLGNHQVYFGPPIADHGSSWAIAGALQFAPVDSFVDLSLSRIHNHSVVCVCVCLGEFESFEGGFGY